MPNPRTICPHCKQDYPNNLIKRHMAVCFSDPEIRDRAYRFMHEHAVNGVAITSDEYTVIARANNLPGTHAIDNVFGSWLNYLAAIGLKSRGDTQNIDWNAVYAELRRISADIHDGEICPSQNEWELFGDMDIPKYVLTHSRAWEEIAEAAGLTVMPQKYHRRQAQIRRRQWTQIQKQPPLRCADSDHAATRAMDFPLSAIDRGERVWFDRTTHTQVTAQVYELR